MMAVRRRPLHTVEDLTDLILHKVAQAFTAPRSRPHSRHNLLRGRQADVGRDQQLLERLDRVDVDRPCPLFTRVGLLDDLTGLRPQTKLVAQLAAGVLLYISGFRFNAALPWAIDFFVVLFWVVAIALLWFVITLIRVSQRKQERAHDDADARRRAGSTGAGGRSRAGGRLPERMVACAHCGVYLPFTDAIRGPGRDGGIYCCVEHRDAARR